MPADSSVPATIRLRSVTKSSFQALVVVPPKTTGNQPGMSVAYMAAKKGVHTFPNGKKFEAGSVETASIFFGPCAQTGLTKSWETIYFKSSFSSTPAFVPTLQTARNEAGALPGSYSKPFLTVVATGLGATQVRVSLELGEASKYGTVSQPESLGYIVMEQGSGPPGAH